MTLDAFLRFVHAVTGAMIVMAGGVCIIALCMIAVVWAIEKILNRAGCLKMVLIYFINHKAIHAWIKYHKEIEDQK